LLGRTLPLSLSLLLLIGCALPPAPETPEPSDPLRAAVQSLERCEGLLTLHVDAAENTVLLELPAPTDASGRCAELLLVHGLRRGLGSNPVGLDRGQLSGAELLVIRRRGRQVLFERPNLRFRAGQPDPAARRAVEESFATSVIWGTEVRVIAPDGRSLVDLGPLLVSDRHGIADQLSRSSGSTYRLDPARSAVTLEALRALPANIELEASLTFTTEGSPGREISGTAPDGRAVTLLQHISLIELPPAGYRPRLHDPRSGTFSTETIDPTAPLTAPTRIRYAERHRLAPGETLTYYVDRGAPEPVRSALLTGAGWWAEAFEAAGLPGAFRVELLPEDVDPLDVRYSVIQWVHRETRGWSYGTSITDPRTGEILKGHVTLGSLRVRQDRLLFEGLLGVESTGTGTPGDPIEISLARIRQLAAHEVGHTLGLAHNFAGSARERASVMDYPPPRVRVAEDGSLDLSDAYGVGVGEWDRHAIRWLYGAHGVDAAGRIDEEEERRQLRAILDEGIAGGLLYLSDADARSPGASDPRASLWDDGSDAVAGLEGALAVRRIALSRFGPGNLPEGRPRTELQEVFTPVYLHHRYALEAAVKTIAGVEYGHGVRGDAMPPPRVIPRDRQERALSAVLQTMTPEFLRVPPGLLPLLVPATPGSARSVERLPGATAPMFDPLAAARVAATLSVDLLLDEARLARLVNQGLTSPGQLTIEDLLRRLTETFQSKEEEREAWIAGIDAAVERVILDRLMARAGSATVTAEVRTAIDAILGELLARLGPPYEGRQLRYDNGHRAQILRDLERHLARAPVERSGLNPAPPPPPGSPIGCGCDRY